MTWVDVIQWSVLMIVAMCCICLCIAQYNLGRRTEAFIRAQGRFPTKRDEPVE